MVYSNQQKFLQDCREVLDLRRCTFIIKNLQGNLTQILVDAPLSASACQQRGLSSHSLAREPQDFERRCTFTTLISLL